MEVGGVDDKDREPDENERVTLQKYMESFCKDFHKIEQKLSERGVVVGTRLSMAPSDEAYAQIINYSDYILDVAVQTFVSNKNNQTVAAKKNNSKE